jgi:3-oxoadipate enol-lactonase
MVQVIGYTFGRVTAELLPPGRPVELAGRGTTFVYDQPGPRGAPTLALLHGLGATGALNWFPSFGPLSQRFRVVAVDLRGHGRGIPVRGPFHLADCADDVVAVADALDVERVIPVGYSLGGPIAQLMWQRHRDRVDGMVLCATSRNFGGTIVERCFYGGLGGAALALRLAGSLPWFRRDTSGAPAIEERDLDGMRLPRWALDELRRCSPVAMIAAAHALGRFTSHEWIGDVDVPTAVVVTAKDRLVSPARQLRLAQAIPGASIHPAHTDHAACVLGARRFVPALVDACDAVADRLPMRGGATALSG